MSYYGAMVKSGDAYLSCKNFYNNECIIHIHGDAHSFGAYFVESAYINAECSAVEIKEIKNDREEVMGFEISLIGSDCFSAVYNPDMGFTEQNPYTVDNVDELQDVINKLRSHYFRLG